MRRSFGLISPATNILEGWDIFHLKGDIHSFVLSTSSFLYDIGELRYKQNKIGYQIRRIEILSHLAEIFTRKYWPCRTKKFLSKDNPSKSPNSKSNSSQNTIFNKLKRKLHKKHFLGPKITMLCRAFFCQHCSNTVFRILEIWYPFCFAYILAAWYRTEK